MKTTIPLFMVELYEFPSPCVHTELNDANTSAPLARSPTTTCTGIRSFPALLREMV